MGLFVGFFRFSEGDEADGTMMETGGVPSESGEQSFFSKNVAFFLKVGRETLEDTRVGVVTSRL